MDKIVDKTNIDKLYNPHKYAILKSCPLARKNPKKR